MLPWNYGPIHGGAITTLPNGNLAHCFNSRTGQFSIATHRYHTGIAELAPGAPFEMLRIGKSPVLYGQEGYNLDGCTHFKANVVFACGAIWEDDRLLIAHGWNDHRARIAKVTMKQTKL